MTRIAVTIAAAQDGQRLDLALVALDVGLSRRKIKAIIDVGGAYLNGKRVRVASRVVHTRDKVLLEFNPDALATLKDQQAALRFREQDILYRQHGLIAVNKPPGMPSQPTRDQAVVHVAAALKDYFKARNEPVPDLIPVHRLDKETSGVMLVATSAQSAAWLMEQFKTREVEKTYHALCFGIPERETFEVRNYLSEIHKKLGLVQVVKSGGKLAITHFQLLAKNQDLGLSLLACAPLTGRSHQIRVQLESAGFPIIGDKRYGTAVRRALPDELAALAAQHHFLHARLIRFKPSAKASSVSIEADYPPAFAAFAQASALQK